MINYYYYFELLEELATKIINNDSNWKIVFNHRNSMFLKRKDNYELHFFLESEGKKLVIINWEIEKRKVVDLPCSVDEIYQDIVNSFLN